VAPSSPDMMFSMSPEPESGFHTRMMMTQANNPSATTFSHDSIESLLTRPSPVRSSQKVHISHISHSLAPARPAQLRSVSDSSGGTVQDEPLLYTFPTSTSTTRRGPLSLPHHARGLGSPASNRSTAILRLRPRSERDPNARARAIIAGRPPTPPTSSSSSASSRSCSPDRHFSADTSAATSAVPSRSPSRDSKKNSTTNLNSNSNSNSHSSAETVSIRLSEALQEDLRLGSPVSRKIPMMPVQTRRPTHQLLVRSPVTHTAPRVSMEVASSYRPDEGLMRKKAGSPPSPSPARVLAGYVDPMSARGRRRPAIS
jgi:hypothetical protein